MNSDKIEPQYITCNKYQVKKDTDNDITDNIHTEKIKEQENIIKNYEARIKCLENLVLKRQKRTKYPDSNVVYLITDKNLKKEREYIIGKAKDLTNRLSTYNKTEDFEVIYYKGFETEKQMTLGETMVLEKLSKYKKQFNRDKVILPIGENIKIFIDAIDDAFIYFN